MQNMHMRCICKTFTVGIFHLILLTTSTDSVQLAVPEGQFALQTGVNTNIHIWSVIHILIVMFMQVKALRGLKMLIFTVSKANPLSLPHLWCFRSLKICLCFKLIPTKCFSIRKSPRPNRKSAFSERKIILISVTKKVHRPQRYSE